MATVDLRRAGAAHFAAALGRLKARGRQEGGAPIPGELPTRGPELIANGTFDNDTSGWATGNGGTLSLSNGTVVLTKTTTANPFFHQAIALESGKTYEILVSIVESEGNSAVRLGSSPANLQYINSGANGPREYAGTYTPASNITAYLSLVYTIATVGASARYDNISVKEVLA